ncbi:hypothetical protein N7528_007559 [Penicillium herquei]|nr:hypothetical protein N7528_007559 [Penicillium herquei]
MPASFQSVFSIKPSSGRISFKGAANTGRGQEVMPTVVGIMGNSVQALMLVFKSLLSTEPWKYDPYTLPIPWREDMQFDPSSNAGYKPAFGLMLNNSLITPHPPISRALRMVRQALDEDGYQLVDWAGPSQTESISIHVRAILMHPIELGDGCGDVYESTLLSGEPFVPEIQNLFPGGKPKPPIPLPKFEEAVRIMKSYREKHLEYWMSTAELTGDRPVEAIISPVTPYASITPGNFKHSGYISCFNVLDYATVVIPVTLADKDIDVLDPKFKPLSKEDASNMMTYNPTVHHGAPASIQLIGKSRDEERLLSIASLVVEALARYKARHGDDI